MNSVNEWLLGLMYSKNIHLLDRSLGQVVLGKLGHNWIWVSGLVLDQRGKIGHSKRNDSDQDTSNDENSKDDIGNKVIKVGEVCLDQKGLETGEINEVLEEMIVEKEKVLNEMQNEVNNEKSIDKQNLGANDKEIVYDCLKECFDEARNMENCFGGDLSNRKECLDMVLKDGIRERNINADKVDNHHDNTELKLNNKSNVTINNASRTFAKIANKEELNKNLFSVPTNIKDNGDEVVIFYEDIVEEGNKKWINTLWGYFVGCNMSPAKLREDLKVIYELVMEEYKDNLPEGFDKMLWGDLMIMFNQGDTADFWDTQQNWKLISWKLHSSSGVHTIMTSTGLVIHMFVENRYPLAKEVLSNMLELKLETEEESSMALELIKFVKQQLEEFEDSNDDDSVTSDHEEAERRTISLSRLIEILFIRTYRLGKPLVMDNMTTSMCYNGTGRAAYARVIVEIDAKKGFKDSIEVQYRDKNDCVIRYKFTKVKCSWKPAICSLCCVFGHSFVEVRGRKNGFNGYGHQKGKDQINSNVPKATKEKVNDKVQYKYVVLAEDEGNEEVNEVIKDRRLAVDKYNTKKRQPTCNETDDLTYDIKEYFKYRWKEVCRNKYEIETKSDKDIVCEENEVASKLVAHEIDGVDTRVLLN
ncbi:hypothetical protein Tco_1506454 [Tanacetum coccineum]